jgi:hypothetical protein
MKIWNELTPEKPSDLLATVSLSSHASPGALAVLIACPAPRRAHRPPCSTDEACPCFTDRSALLRPECPPLMTLALSSCDPMVPLTRLNNLHYESTHIL